MATEEERIVAAVVLGKALIATAYGGPTVHIAALMNKLEAVTNHEVLQEHMWEAVLEPLVLGAEKYLLTIHT